MNFQESTTILNACTKWSGNLLKAPHILEIVTWSYSYFPRIIILSYLKQYNCMQTCLLSNQNKYMKLLLVLGKNI